MVGTDVEKVFVKIYTADYDVVWESVLGSLKSYPLDVANKEGGAVQTKWQDNTAETDLAEVFGGQKVFLKAQFRLRVRLAKGFYQGKPSVKVTLRKEQLVQNDVLEGWRPVETNGITENTFLYRMGRIILMKIKLARMEELRINEEVEAAKKEDFSEGSDGGGDFEFEFDDFDEEDDSEADSSLQ